jgi:hypothetical protein
MAQLDEWRERLARCLHSVADRIEPDEPDEPGSGSSVVDLARRAQRSMDRIKKIRDQGKRDEPIPVDSEFIRGVGAGMLAWYCHECAASFRHAYHPADTSVECCSAGVSSDQCAG